MSVDNGRRIIDQDTALVINPGDNIIIDSIANGSRKISYEALCAAIAETLGIAAISAKANGAMQRTTYDADGDNIVDNSEALEGHAASYFATASDLSTLSDTVTGLSTSKMDKSTYDSNGNGIVDNAELVNGHSVHSDVPPNAVFTDTIYDDTVIQGKVGNLTNLDTTAKTSLVAAINEVNAAVGSEKTRAQIAEAANANALQAYKDLLGLTVDEEGYICQTI